MKTLFIFFSLLFCFQGKTQKIIEATEQGWFSGVCCLSGTNYSFIIQLEEAPRSLEQIGFYLPHSGKIVGQIVTEFETKEGYFCTISYESRRDRSHNYPIEEEITVIERRKFDGAALIALKINGNIVELIVDEFKQLEFLGYP